MGHSNYFKMGPGIRKNLANARYLLSVGKPLVFLRYAEKLFSTRVLGRISPRQIDIALTFDCNLSCDHCFATTLSNHREQEMDEATLKRVAQDCRRLGITVIHFTGGEVLLRKDLEKVISFFSPKKNLIYIQSNGTLATYERLVSLKKAGLDFYGVSLESPDKQNQDRFRHYEGYFDTALHALSMAQKAGLQTSVNITIDNRLIRSYKLSALISELGRMGHIVYGNLPVPVGRFKTRKDLLWMGEERKILKDLTHRFSFFRTEFDSNFGPYGCPAMKEKIYLCAYGDVLACPYIHISFGNVKKESLMSITRRCLDFKVFNTYHDHCLAAENQAFIEGVMDKAGDYDEQPVNYTLFTQELNSTLLNENMMDSSKYLDLTLTHVPCPLCGSDKYDTVVTAPDFETPYTNPFRVVQCRDCNMMYTSPRPSMDDLFLLFYQDDYVCYTKTGFADNIREQYLCKSRFRALKHLMPEKGRFLDVGCSYGYFLSFLQNNTGWDAFGCEPNREMAARAVARGLKVEAKTLAESGYPDDFFDMVYMSHVLEHVPDLQETVRNVFRILKPGGLFITENPDVDAPIRKPFASAWWGYHLPRHLSHFNRKTLSRLLASHGFDVEQTKPCFRPGPIAWSIQNLLKKRGWSDRIATLFGVQNPFFVALCGIPGLIYLRRGYTDMMETHARKPNGGRK